MDTVRHTWISRLAGTWLLLCTLLLLWLPLTSGAQDDTQPADVYLFWVAGCPHCEREIKFLQQLQQEQPQLRVHMFEITATGENRVLFLDVVQRLGITEPVVPLTIIGNNVWMGFTADLSSSTQMRDRIDTCMKIPCPDMVAGLLEVRRGPAERLTSAMHATLPEILHLPLVGEIALRDLSLPALTVLLGALDGFNPCAMWTLVFLIGLLLGMKDSLRMWMLGCAFIAGSAAVYFLFMAAWLNLLLFLGALPIIRIVIGLVAVGGGFYYLREYLINKGGTCPVTATERRQQVFRRLRQLVQQRSFLIALGGILSLAFLVNLVELLCSAGIPAVYTQILAMHQLPAWQYYAYLLLYILVFMADDVLVFVAAMLTLRVSGITARYSRYTHLIGGIVLLIVGALMLLRPDLLMLG